MVNHDRVSPEMRATRPEFDKRRGERRKPQTLWGRFKAWLDSKFQGWKHYFKCGIEAAGVAMSFYQFFKAFGKRALLGILGLGMLLAPIEA